MHYVLVNPRTDTVILLDKESFIVPVDEDDPRKEYYTDGDFIEAADNVRFTVIPVIETLEWKDEESA